MKVSYLVEITDPSTSMVKVSMTGQRPSSNGDLEVFLPSWSPGSYLMREYSRHIRWVRATQENGEVLWTEQTAKGTWLVDWRRSGLKKELTGFTFSYEIYLHELTVRTSYVDMTHAYLHGPSYLVGVSGGLENPTIEFRFPPLWSHLSTALTPVEGGPRNKFIYDAKNYDELVDCPVEIGCHETDGFMLEGVPHALAFEGEVYPHGHNLKQDIQKACAAVARTMGGALPFTHYQFITHFKPKIYGGLEHMNSTALQFDGRRLANRKDYLTFLSLTAHEYFHAWNIKRIRPRALGPFDYRNEAYTTMLWLAEGLTSFMDDLFVYRAELCTLEEYLDFVKSNLDTYFATPGRRFHSLEDSSFNAWIKLYRPDENSRNSSVSYYLKGGLVFAVLHGLLSEQGKGVDDLLRALWKQYQARPDIGVDKEEVYGLIEELGGKKVLDAFIAMVETTQEIDFDGGLQRLGLELRWQDPAPVWFGVEWDHAGDRVLVKSVLLDSPAARAGLNPADEIVAVNGLRVLREDVEKWATTLLAEQAYDLTVARMGRLTSLQLVPGPGPRTLKEIAIVDRAKAEKLFKGLP